MAETKPKVSHEAQVIIDDVIVRDGMSYVDAVKWCETLAERKAAPYREAAREIQRWLERHDA